MKLCGVLLAFAIAGMPAAAARPTSISRSAIRWMGTEGHVIHGYMALPSKARGRQPAVLVLADAAAGGQTAAQGVVDMLARAGFLACTPRGDEPDADLGASLGWLQSNRYATGQVALVGWGATASMRAAELAQIAARPPAALLVISDRAPSTRTVPTLALPAASTRDDLPAAAIAFLKEHLR